MAWLRRHRYLAVAILAAFAYAVVLTAASFRKHDAFLTGGYDLGIFDQAVWLLGHGHEPFSTIRGRNLFADHFQPALALLAPLGAVGATPGGLLVLQASALGATAPLLYKLARIRGASEQLALAVALMWLASPVTQWANLFDFHPEAIVPALLVAGAILLERDRIAPFLVTAVLAASVKEDICLVYVMWGAVLALRGQRRLGGFLAVTGLAWFVLATKVAIPALGGNYDYYSARFGGDRGSSLGKVLLTFVEHPLRTVADAGTLANARILIALVLCTAGLALFAPLMLLLALPTLAANLLSAYSYQHDLHFHYQLIPAAVFAIASAYGAPVFERHLPDRLKRPVRRAFLAGTILVALALSPALEQLRKAGDPKGDAKRQALALIPPHASVAAAPDLAPHLAHRHEIYQLPEPFFTRHANGEYWTDAELARRAGRVQYVAYDLDALDPFPRSQVEQLPAILRRRGYVQIFSSGEVKVFRRLPSDRAGSG